MLVSSKLVVYSKLYVNLNAVIITSLSQCLPFDPITPTLLVFNIHFGLMFSDSWIGQTVAILYQCYYIILANGSVVSGKKFLKTL